MFKDVDERFNLILEIAQKNDLQLDLIKKAYNKAKELHYFQKRKDGEPYIVHPVEVALILARLNFDENVISGALLHDTIEDCGYTKEQMKIDFNETIMNLVDCVSAIDKEKYIFDSNNIFEDSNFVKASSEEQTFKKLITIGKKNPCGFAIKFADRLHNLSTISCFEYNKQLEKVRETEKWILPIAEKLSSFYFYFSIKNECFKIVNRKANAFFEHFNMYHQANQKNVNNLITKLKEKLMPLNNIADAFVEDIKECQVFEEIKKVYKNIEISNITQGQILKVANYNIYCLFNNSSAKKQATSDVLNALNNFSNLKIIDASISNFSNKPYFEVQDEFKNKYRFFVLSQSEYSMLQVGTIDGQIEVLDEDNINDLNKDLIKIYTRSGEIKYIQKDSTVLDFAFKLHKDIGFGFKYAIINKSKTKFPPYTILNNNDQVEIIVDRENDEIKKNAELKWLAYVNTELAKKTLIMYFTKKFNINK